MLIPLLVFAGFKCDSDIRRHNFCIIDDYNVPDNTPPRIDYAVRIEGTLLPSIASSIKSYGGEYRYRT